MSDSKELHAEIARLNKVIEALMDRAERNASIQGSDFNLFQTAITLGDQVRQRTGELEAALRENEKITRALRESENHHRLLVENAPVCIHEIALDGRISSMNMAGLRMLGCGNECEVQGLLYLDAVSIADRPRIADLLRRAYAGEASHFEFESAGPAKRVYKSCFVPILNKNGGVDKLMGITEDITERKLAEEKVHNMAFYDTLTQLANRRLLSDRLGQAIAACRRSGCYGAVMFLDMDNFKPLNDQHGHDVGDLLLIEVAHRIGRCVRETDTVARFGGDEFVVLIGEMDVEPALSQEMARIVAEKIRTALSEPYSLGGRHGKTLEYRCSSSIGVVLFSGNAAGQEEVLKRADLAMYRAKEHGRNRVSFFES